MRGETAKSLPGCKAVSSSSFRYNREMFYVYLLQNDVSKETYIGFTNSIKQRIAAHNNGGKKFTTRNDGIWKLIYTEIYKSEKDARERESKLKHHGSGKHELLKRLKNSLLDT
ncbi:MAG: GIY-YIG nuclease family protein [Minisyncoccia bacterium]